MKFAEMYLDAIIEDFVLPTIERLSDQLKRNILLDVCISLSDNRVVRHISTRKKEKMEDLHGEMRIVALETFIENRIKYELQCIFPETNGLEDFSGIRLNGSVSIVEGKYLNKYNGFAYTYNSREWGKKFRDF